MIIINNFNGIGRCVRDPELRYIPSGTAVCNFTIAIDKQETKDYTDIEGFQPTSNDSIPF